MAPNYQAADLRRLSGMPSRRRLRSSLTHQLDVSQSQCATVGDRTFAVAGARLWNSLPPTLSRGQFNGLLKSGVSAGRIMKPQKPIMKAQNKVQ